MYKYNIKLFSEIRNLSLYVMHKTFLLKSHYVIQLTKRLKKIKILGMKRSRYERTDDNH